MLVTLISQEKVFSLHLPEKVSGKYWIIDEEGAQNHNRLIPIEADEESREWKVYADKEVKLFDSEMHPLQQLALKEGELYPVRLGKHETQMFMFVEPFSEDRSTFRKYVVSGDTSLLIGKTQDNQIIIDNRFISSRHAQLMYNNGKWILQGNPQTNGTYVNRHRVDGQVMLNVGDTVFILGFKIVIGSNFISMNNPGGSIRINTNALAEYVKNEYVDDETIVPENQEFYYRSPRFVRSVEPISLRVDSPTQKQDGDDTPIIFSLIPSLLMGVASFSTAIISIVNLNNTGGNIITALPTMIMAVSMLVGMVLFPFIMKKREKKIKKGKEEVRRTKYLKYLDNLREEIKRNVTYQEEILKAGNPSVIEYASTADFWERKLWGKTPEQDDYLFVRLGIGNTPLEGEITFPEDRFSIDDDYLREELFSFQKEERLLMNVPVGVNLLKERVFGIVGDSAGVFNLLNNVLMQILLLHSYDEVKLICIYEKKDEDKLSYLRFARHIWDDEGRERFIAVNEDNLRELGIYMGRMLRERGETGDVQRAERVLPEYILVSTSKELANKCAFMEDMLQNAELLDLAVICAYQDIKSLPKECHAVAEVNGDQGQLYDSTTKHGKISFRQDKVTSENALLLTQKMAAFQLDLNRGRYDLPGMLGFLDMFGVGKIEHLNITERWKNNDPIKTLKTPIGVDTNGETFYLDLHEEFHGPHGLVAGMTGSGKSEFIITYILSMAINYHPDEVAFVLIDYKGGGLTGAFENRNYRLPHLAGTITNLDSGGVMRSILSIKSELQRREHIFNEARVIANEGTMDIYKYQKMYRNGQVSEPLPHLIIISDEFAELKSQQPEFLEQLISTARVGRSLGVHLILATQKPSGVVNDQIWANSKFKVCLKVQDRSDSMEMIRKPDAAGIAETGRFFLQVGYDELFEKGQSAWSGAPYMDADTTGSELDSSIEVIDDLGNVVDKIQVQKNTDTVSHGKQIVRIMQYLDKLAAEEDIHERQLWMPEIPENVYIDELIEKYSYAPDYQDSLRVAVGEYDDPYKQKQWLLEVNFTGSGNTLLYGAAGSGDEMFLTSMFYSVYKAYSPEELNTYILDFGSESLKIFENAPHTGGVIVDGESEKLSSFFSLIKKEIRNRKKMLVSYGGDFQRYNRNEETRMPFILVVINNYSHFVESFEQYEETVTSMVRECPKYGIYFLITASSAGAVRYRLTQHFPQMYVLQLNDSSDYISILGKTGGIVPSPMKGRGIMKKDEVYVFQTGKIVPAEEDETAFLQKFISELDVKYADRRARKIPVVPKFIGASEVADSVSSISRIPLGVAYDNYEYMYKNTAENNILVAAAVDRTLAGYFAASMIELTSALENAQRILFSEDPRINAMAADAEIPQSDKLDETIVEIFEKCVERNNNYKKTNGNPTVDMSPIIVAIFEFSKLYNKLSADGKDKINVLLSKVEGFCNVFFIIADSYSGLASYSTFDWMSERVNGCGLWIGNGVADQVRFQIHSKDRSMNLPTEDNTGYYIDRGIARKLRLIMPLETRKEDGDEE